MNDPRQIGHTLEDFAGHRQLDEGWTYTRNLGGLKQLRYASDSTGYDRWIRRLGRALDLRGLAGNRGLFAELGMPRRTPKQMLFGAVAHFHVNLSQRSHLPDGQCGPVIAHWEEDGQYLEMVGPTVGMKIAAFLIAEPEHPHAQAISAEIQRVRAVGRGRRKNGE